MPTPSHNVLPMKKGQWRLWVAQPRLHVPLLHNLKVVEQGQKVASIRHQKLGVRRHHPPYHSEVEKAGCLSYQTNQISFYGHFCLLSKAPYLELRKKLWKIYQRLSCWQIDASMNASIDAFILFPNKHSLLKTFPLFLPFCFLFSHHLF